MKASALFLALFISILPFAYAEEVIKPNPVAEYLKACSVKADFGLANFMVGWTTAVSKLLDAPRQGKWKGTGPLLRAFGEGLVLAPVNIVGGIANVITSPIPVKIPLPQGGVDTQRLTCQKELVKTA